MDRRRRHERRQSAEQAEIGGLPAVGNPRRRAMCRQSLHLFLASYFPHSTGADPFSDDHVKVIDRLEAALHDGGRFVNAVYRGFAKTTITENTALWAALYGLREFVAIFGADKAMAKNLIASITQELCENDLLLEDFPEVCVCFRALDGKPQRAKSQTHGGHLTHLVMTGDTLVLPTIWTDHNAGECTASSGAIIRARGLLGAARGMKYKRADGHNARPDFALLDDIQTDESARSPKQVEKRLGLIRKSVLKSAGHSRAIACVVNATVIAHEDVIDQLLDPERNPAWDGVRIKMVRRWADAHETLWLGEYASIRRGFDRDIPGDQQRAAKDATEFYRAHRAEMDAGCEVSWLYCFDPDAELSAIQHAYNLYIDDPPDVFEAECQNEPSRETDAGLVPLDAHVIARRISGHPRGQVPAEADHLTAFIDVHDDVLYWAVLAWRMDCSGWIVDYGTHPDQRRAYFHKRQATKTLRRKYQGVGREGAITRGLTDLVAQLAGREWLRADKVPIRIGKLLIDSGWVPEEVFHVCRTSPHAAILQPSRGVGVRAGDTPIAEYQRKPGRQINREQWYVEAGKRGLRVIRYDTNHWKTWLHGRLSCDPTTAGALTLFGGANTDHRLLADHLVNGESPTEVLGRGRTIVEWRPIPSRDNHWLDCLVGAAVAASQLGCSLAGAAQPAQKSRRQRAIEAAQQKGLL